MLGKKKPGVAAKESNVETLIGPNTRIAGDVEFVGGLLVEGQITGNVSVAGSGNGSLTLAERGAIVGDVRVDHQIIDGAVKGDVYAAEYLSLLPNARITGNVHYALLEMAVGAQVNGSLLFGVSPVAQEAPLEPPVPDEPAGDYS